MILEKLIDVSFRYGNVSVFEKINLEINLGDFIVLTGENGSGKTTLLKILIGLLKPNQGVVQRIYKEEGMNLAYISQQNTYSNTFPANVWEVIISGRMLFKKRNIRYSSEDKEVCTNYMKSLGLFESKDKPFCYISGGQKHKALLARALVSESDIIVLDEPMSGLDCNSREELYKILYELNRTKKRTIIMVSHEMVSMPQFIKVYKIKNKCIYSRRTYD